MSVVLLFVDKLFTAPASAQQELSYKQSFIVGCFQVLSILFPGLSRSAATIIGGMSQKLTKKTAAEFSFFLAVPTMLAVTCYSVFLKTYDKSGLKGFELILKTDDHLSLFVKKLY